MATKSMSEVKKQELRAQEEAESTRPRKIFVPRADIYETQDALVVIVDMPGVDEKSVDITLERNVLTLHGTAATDVPEGYALAYAEYELGDYHREFILSEEVKREGIQAAMRNGVLKLTLPKAEPARKIQVRVE
jgi:HSP20 family molecular chaperone IbpA